MNSSPLKSLQNDPFNIESPSKSGLKYLDQNELENMKKLPLMHPMAVEFAARKIAASGDLRKALDVCRYTRIINIATQLKLSKQKVSQIKHLLKIWTNYRKLELNM